MKTALKSVPGTGGLNFGGTLATIRLSTFDNDDGLSVIESGLPSI